MRIPLMDEKKSSSQQKNTLAELLPGPSPPPAATSASNMVAQNPFDDPIMAPMPGKPSAMSGIPPHSQPMSGIPPHSQPMSGIPPHSQPMSGIPPHSQPMSGPPMPGVPSPHGKVYPPNQPMVFNPSNPSAPPIYPCGICHKEVHENEQAVLCESGCNFWFHRMCTGLTMDAFSMLKAEVYAEWVCDRCLSTKNIPLVKLKP